MPTSSGARLGPYQLGAAIGAGGMGEVYRAHDSRLGRDVAVKILPADVADDPERLRRFEREARAAAALNHPNILSVFDVGREHETSYLVTELLEGQTLRDVIEARRSAGAKPPDYVRVVEYATQIADGLAAAHARGIVHRDLKPENLFITADGRVKILDFGLAKTVEHTAAVAGATQTISRGPNATAPHVILGTPGYMAPEQVRGESIDHRADIFAFGCVLYELLGGTRAFGGATTQDTLSAILRDAPAPLGDARPDLRLPPQLTRIVERCLEKAPAARFQSVADLAFALGQLAHAATPGEAGARGTRAVLPTRGRRRWLELAGWIAAVALAAAAIPMLRDRLRTPSPEVVRFSISVPNPSPEPDLALSPDGRTLAYAAQGEAGQRILWVRRVDEREARPLGGTARARFPFWSPDSRHIAFSADNQLKRVPAAGGPVQSLCEISPGVKSTGHHTGASWSRDGFILFGGATPEEAKVFRVPDTGGTPVLALKPDPQKARVSGWPHLLPDGRHFLYSTFGTGTRAATVEGEPLHTVLPVGGEMVVYADGHLLAVRDGMLMAYPFDLDTLRVHGEPSTIDERAVISWRNYAAVSASEDGRLTFRRGRNAPRQLRWFSRQGAPLADLGRPGFYQQVNLAPDGRRVLLDELGADGKRVDLLVTDLASGVASPLVTGAGLFTTSSLWTRDGRVLYTTPVTPSRPGTLRLHSPTDGTDSILLTERVVATDTTHDGSIVITSPQKIELLSPGSRQRKDLLAQARGDEAHVHVSPNGRWVTWQSFESGQAQVYVATFPAFGARRQVSAAGGCQPRWSRDGGELFYVTLDGKLMSVGFRTGAATPEVTTPRILFDLPLVVVPAHEQYDVSADGRFLVAVERERSATIEVVLNWTGLLQRRTP